MEEGKNGIPAEEFEQLMSEYLPVTAEQLRNIATFDAENKSMYGQSLDVAITHRLILELLYQK